MKTMHAVLVAISTVLVFSAAPSIAKKPAAKPEAVHYWDREPDAVLGIPVGSEFPGAIPHCPEIGKKSSTDAMCYEKAYGDFYDIWHTPKMSFPYGALVNVFDGKIAYVTLEIKQIYFGDVKQTLIERFGKPQLDEQNVVQTNGGAKLSSREISWIGRNVSMIATERKGQIDTSEVVVISVPLINAKKQNRQKSTTDDASKL